MSLILFTLTMPGVGSWNGKWTGESNYYAMIRNLSKEDTKRILETKNYSYSWDDGWRANISVEKIDSRDRKKIERKINGFMGYEWMVDSIIKNNKILTGDEK